MMRIVQLPAFWSRHARVILSLVLLAVGVHDIFGTNGFLAMRRTQKQIEQTRAKIEQLNHDNSELTGQIESLRTDPKAIERIAREEMGLARPGEMIFKLPAPPEKSPGPDRAP